ncbi:MAG: RHS repeat-associated core domain-containing protein [Limnohabitans sp.]|nr:RHS repeat-associated core domain-containing protein [Limnohabitans sp.]
MKNPNDYYRFGFNGQEKNNDIYGRGTHLDFKFRMYDSRIARFNSNDPLKAKYPWLTPYQFASNTPIQAEDIEGGEARIVTIGTGSDGKQYTTVFQMSDYKSNEWRSIQNGFFGGFSHSQQTKGFTWMQGFNEYTSGAGARNFVGPGVGTLTIDATGKVMKLYYDPKSARNQNFKRESIWVAIKEGMKATAKMWNEPAIAETRDGVCTMASLAFGIGELKAAATMTNFWVASGVANDIDDITSFSDNATSQMTNENDQVRLNTAISLFKATVGLKNLRNNFVEVVSTNSLSGVQAVNGALDANDIAEGIDNASNSTFKFRGPNKEDKDKRGDSDKKKKSSGGGSKPKNHGTCPRF